MSQIPFDSLSFIFLQVKDEALTEETQDFASDPSVRLSGKLEAENDFRRL